MKKYHVRFQDREIIDEAIKRKILRTTQYVTVAMSLENNPYLVSFSHGYDEENNCIYFHCAKEGKTVDYLKSNNRVWGQALLDYKYSEGNCTHLYASVHFSGKVTFLDTIEEKQSAMEFIMKQLDSNPERLIADLTRERLNRINLGRIDIEHLTGKKHNEVEI